MVIQLRRMKEESVISIDAALQLPLYVIKESVVLETAT